MSKTWKHIYEDSEKYHNVCLKKLNRVRRELTELAYGSVSDDTYHWTMAQAAAYDTPFLDFVLNVVRHKCKVYDNLDKRFREEGVE